MLAMQSLRLPRSSEAWFGIAVFGTTELRFRLTSDLPAHCCADAHFAEQDSNNQSRLAGYELEGQTLSPIDSVALTTMRPRKSAQKGQVLDPSWTPEYGVNP